MQRAGCPEEDSPQTQNGLGVVVDAEPVVYALIEPRTSQVGSVVHFTTGDWRGRQISVCRARACDFATFYDRAVAGQVAKGSTFKGYVWATAAEIRQIKVVNTKGEEQDIGAVCVIDASLENFEAHARMGECSPGGDFWGRHQRLAARLQLQKVLLSRGISTENGQPFG